MPTFKNLEEMAKYLAKNQIKKALENEVAEKVRDLEQLNIDSQVYERYNIVDGTQQEPYIYQRRYDDGGLRDRKNMTAATKETSNGVQLSVENVTKGKDDNFVIAGLIEYGDGFDGMNYTYKENRDGTSYQYLNSRPFTKSTIQELKETGEHVKALAEGLKKQDIDVK